MAAMELAVLRMPADMKKLIARYARRNKKSFGRAVREQCQPLVDREQQLVDLKKTPVAR